jgi:hypothetical protein
MKKVGILIGTSRLAPYPLIPRVWVRNLTVKALPACHGFPNLLLSSAETIRSRSHTDRQTPSLVFKHSSAGQPVVRRA